MKWPWDRRAAFAHTINVTGHGQTRATTTHRCAHHPQRNGRTPLVDETSVTLKVRTDAGEFVGLDVCDSCAREIASAVQFALALPANAPVDWSAPLRPPEDPLP